jgi:Ser/Thr protein kinase RdoA (MazF antagonist)
MSIWGNQQTEYFYSLSPDVILEAVEQAGLQPTGAVNALNSMENRVYDLGILTDGLEKNIICKFYRPGRWSEQQILEEHQFLLDLNQEELPVIAPIVIDGKSLFCLPEQTLYYAFFKKEGGRTPDELSEEQLAQLGRLLARLHLIGKQKTASTRVQMTPENYLEQNLNTLLQQKLLPPEVERLYQETVLTLLEKIRPLFANTTLQRIHGDCHLSNILWQDGRALLMDFDDMVMGPPVQDIWLLIPGQDSDAKLNRQILLDAYETFAPFDYTSLSLIEPLRTMRVVNFATWLAKRRHDPAFERAFPHFYQGTFWQHEIQNLQEQLSLLT